MGSTRFLAYPRGSFQRSSTRPWTVILSYLIIQVVKLEGLEAYDPFEPVLEPDFEVVITPVAVGSPALNGQGN